MFGSSLGLFGTPARFDSTGYVGTMPRQVGNVQNVQPTYGAAMQHPLQPVGVHYTNPRPQAAVPQGPQGVHNFTPQGQQFANQQALAAEQKRLADALRAQQEAEAAAQAQQNDGGVYYYQG